MSFSRFLNSLFNIKSNDEYNFTLKTQHELSDEQKNDIKNIYSDLSSNLEVIQSKFNSLINSDINIRKFKLNAKGKEFNAFLLYIEGMVDSKTINDFVLSPLMLNAKNDFSKIISESTNNNVTVRKVRKFNLTDYIYDCLMPQNSVKKSSDFESIISDTNAGNCILFVDTINIAFSLDVKGFKQRSIDTPNNEIIIRGSQEAFNEVIRTNTALIRRIVNNENLIIESINIGKVSKTACAVCYIKNIANDDLVAEVKFRLNNLNIDYLISSGQLEQLIQDNGNYSLPQIMATERPDKASIGLLEGRVIVLVNGSPYALILPATFFDFLSSPEDTNLKHQYSNLLKFIRIIAFVTTLLLPGLYIAITNFHQELIPTELLFAIVASREAVPFPIIFEILTMEICFELIREAGLRVPSPIGPTLGIIGALILGQAAVEASIVSPILIIIVALTGISSFAIPDFSMSFYCRVSRFIYIILGYLLGFLGIAIGIFVSLLMCSSLKSFGVPYLSPFVPISNMHNEQIFLSPIWKREYREDYLNTKKSKKQKDISMNWKYKNK